MPSDSQAFDPSTLAFYDEHAESYLSARPDDVSSKLVAFLGNLQPGCRILELGSGSGRNALEMERLGFDVDATDGSAAMVELANKRLRKPARVLRFDEIQDVCSYDAVLACASLLHVPYPALPSVLARIYAALKPGGWHFASYKTAGTRGLDQHQRYYNQLARSEAEQIYRKVGDWASLSFDEYDGVGHFSEASRWLSVTAHKQ